MNVALVPISPLNHSQVSAGMLIGPNSTGRDVYPTTRDKKIEGID